MTLAIACIACTACAADHSDTNKSAQPAAAGCIATGGGFLQAQLRGAMTADLNWRNEGMQCEGGPRPDGHGLRMTLAGPLLDSTGAAAHRLRFIFGIDYADTAGGATVALPTNLTLILEGEGRMYSTRGSEHCAVEKLERAPLASATGKYDRIHVRGYCTEPANDVSGDSRVLVPTFEFTGIAASETAP